MSDQSLQALVQRMQGKSVTQGWDAVVTLNRTKVNQLLAQQYIQNFNMNSFLKRLNALVKLDEGGRVGLEMTGLLLSQPLLSFENASMTHSRARLTMNVVSGMIAYKSLGTTPRILTSFAVTEAHGFSVVMDIDLEAVTGAVDKHGEVILDLSKAYDFSCDMVDDPLEKLALGRYFGELFTRLPASSRVYRLGMLDFDPDDTLAPRSFIVRTHAAPGGRDQNSDSYGDGAVVLLVRTRNSIHDGDNPGEDFPYLIPDDLDGAGKRLFSGSLVLSSAVVFERFIAPSMVRSVGNDLRLDRVDESNQTARELLAYAGAYAFEKIDMEHGGGGSHWSVASLDPLLFPFHGSGAGNLPLRISVTDGGFLKLIWHSDRKFRFFFTEFHLLIGHEEEEADVRFMFQLEFLLKPVVDPLTSVVSFEALPGEVRKYSVEKINGDIVLYYTFQEAFDRHVADLINSMIRQVAESSLPQLDLFALNHLLFPEQNALLLTHGALPGDLAMFGHIDPRFTSFAVDPTFVTVEAGGQVPFKTLSTRLGVEPAALTWSVRSVEATRSAGEIDQGGNFTAPPRDRMQGQAVRNVVTASGHIDGKDVSASALVVVVGEGTVIMPSMATIDLRNPYDVKLRASSLGSTQLEWKLLSGPGTLQADGLRAVYAPPESVDTGMTVAMIEVKDKITGGTALATMLISKSVFTMNVEPHWHPGVPPKGRLRLNAEGVLPEDEVSWSVIAGGGTVDAVTGEFTAPEKITMPYSVVQAELADPFFSERGYSVIYQSEYASEPTWFELSRFELRIDSPTPNLYANGQQQVSVTITADPAAVDGEPVRITTSELNSILLVNAETHEPLHQTDLAGIPEAEEVWAWNLTRNDKIDFFPSNPVPAAEPDTRIPRERTLYLQTRSMTRIPIAARLTRDDHREFFTNKVPGGGGDKNIIEPNPITPPSVGDKGFSFEAVRVYGEADDDYNMETVDFYVLSLLNGPDQTLPFRSIEFGERQGTVQWESRQFAEDVVSFTGFALPGAAELSFDPALLGEYLAPSKVDTRAHLVNGFDIPEGTLLISLHRTQYWNFDLACERTFGKSVPVDLMDAHGNVHKMSISFESINNRHKLVVRRR